MLGLLANQPPLAERCGQSPGLCKNMLLRACPHIVKGSLLEEAGSGVTKARGFLKDKTAVVTYDEAGLIANSDHRQRQTRAILRRPRVLSHNTACRGESDLIVSL